MEKVIFTDLECQHPNRYSITKTADGLYIIERHPGEVTSEGVISAQMLNDMQDNIAAAINNSQGGGGGTAGGMILPHGTCAADGMGSNTVTPTVSSLDTGMMILQTFTTPVPQYTGHRILQVSTTPSPLIGRFRDQGEPELAAGTYLLRRESNGYLVVVGRMQEQGQGGITPHIGDNGNWFIGDTDTGSPSRGEKGEIGTSVKQTVLYENADGLSQTYTAITVADPAEYDYFLAVTDKGTFPIYYSEKLYGYITGGTFAALGGGGFYAASVCLHAQGATWTPYELAYFYISTSSSPVWATSTERLKLHKIIGVKTSALLPTWNGGAY